MIVVFGVADFAASVAASFASGTFLVDIGAPIVVALGIGVYRGSARAAKWSLVVMVCYVILPACLLVISLMGVDRLLDAPRLILGDDAVRPLARALRGLERPWVMASFAAAGAVAAAVAVLLAVHILRRKSADAARHTPPPMPPPPPPER